MTTEQKEKINAVINEFSKDNDIISIVNSIENGVKTTKNNYGRYMQFLSNYTENNLTLYVISEALKKAGGNIKGINSAICILKGYNSINI